MFLLHKWRILYYELCYRSLYRLDVKERARGKG